MCPTQARRPRTSALSRVRRPVRPAAQALEFHGPEQHRRRTQRVRHFRLIHRCRARERRHRQCRQVHRRRRRLNEGGLRRLRGYGGGCRLRDTENGWLYVDELFDTIAQLGGDQLHALGHLR